MGVRKSVTALIYLIFMYLRVPHFFNTHVDYEVHTLPNHCNEYFYTFSYTIHDLSSFCLLLFPQSSSPQPTLSIPADFVPKKSQPNVMLQAATLVYHHPPLVETDLLYQLIVVLTIVGHCLAALDHSLPIWLF